MKESTDKNNVKAEITLPKELKVLLESLEV